MVAFAPVLFGGQTNSVSAKPSNRIKTEFVEDAKLSPAEIKQVVSLARKCGLQDVEKVITFRYIPDNVRAVEVRSMERTNGRNINYESVVMEKQDWCFLSMDMNPKRMGQFRVNDPFLNKTHLREFTYTNRAFRVRLGTGIEASFADDVIPRIMNGHARFNNGWNRQQFLEFKGGIPSFISKSSLGPGFMIYCREPQKKYIEFKVEKGEITITAAGDFQI